MDTSRLIIRNPDLMSDLAEISGRPLIEKTPRNDLFRTQDFSRIDRCCPPCRQKDRGE